jgi:hypothetical protein
MSSGWNSTAYRPAACKRRGQDAIRGAGWRPGRTEARAQVLVTLEPYQHEAIGIPHALSARL